MADKEKKDKKNWFRKAKNSLRKNQDGAKSGNDGAEALALGATKVDTKIMHAAAYGVESAASGGKGVMAKVGSSAVDSASNTTGRGMDLLENIPVVGEITSSTIDAVGCDDVERIVASDAGVGNDSVVVENDSTGANSSDVDTVGKAISANAPAAGEMTSSVGVGAMGIVSTGATNVTDTSAKENVASAEVEIEKPLDVISADTTCETACVDDVLDITSGASSVEKIASAVDAPPDTSDVVECKDTVAKTVKVKSDPRSEEIVTNNEITPLHNVQNILPAVEQRGAIVDKPLVQQKLDVDLKHDRTEHVERKLGDDDKSVDNGAGKEAKKAGPVKEKPLEILNEFKADEKKGIVGLTRKTPDFLVDFEKRRSIGLVGKKPDNMKSDNRLEKAVPAAATAAAATTGIAVVAEKMETDDGVKEMKSSLVQQGEICAPVPNAPSCDVTDGAMLESDKPADEEVESVEEVSDVSKSKMSSGEEILHVNIQEEQFSEILSGQLRIKEDLIELRSDIYKLRQELHEFRKAIE